MTFDWQQAVTFGIVGVAAGSLARRAWQTWKARDESHCSGCGECGRPQRPADVRPAPQAKPLITLDASVRPPHRRQPPPASPSA